MKHLLFSLFLVFLAAAPAWSKPLVLSSNNPSRTQTTTIKFPISDTADTEAIPVSGYCSVRYQQASGDDVSLYAVTTSTTAATSGTLINAFTASTTTAITFTAGTQWVKAVATDATAGGSVMLIDCAPLVGSGSRNEPTFYVEDYGGKSLTAINNALAACNTWAQANDGRGVVMLPRGKTQIVVSGANTSPLISLPEHVTADPSQYNSSCDLVGWSSVKDYTSGGIVDPVGSSLQVWYPDLMVAANGYKAVIYAPGHNQLLKGFNVVITGDVDGDVDGTTVILAASSTAGSRTFGTAGIKHSRIEDVVIASARLGFGTGLATEFWLNNEIKNVWFNGFSSGWLLVTQSGLANNANLVHGSRWSANTVGIDIPDNQSCQDFYLNGGNTLENNVYGLRLRLLSTCRVYSFGTHWEQDTAGTRIGVNDVLIEDDDPNFVSFGDFFSSNLAVGAHVVRTVAQKATTTWDVIEGGNFRTTTDRPYTYTGGSGIRVNGAAPNIVTTTGTATAKMRGEVHIADHATPTSDVRYTLPAAFAGMTGCFYDNGGGDGGVIIDVDASDEILLYGAGVAVGDRIDSPGVAGTGANGDFICLEAIDDTYWITLGGSGTWVDGGAA